MLFYTGSYTLSDSPALQPRGEGISCFAFDQVSGKAELLHVTPQRNPSYLAVSKDLRSLYAIEELPEGQGPQINAYRIGKKGRLCLLNRQNLTGAYCCHLALVGGQLIAANYLSGNALVFPVLTDGSIGPCRQIIRHSGKSSHRFRQQSPHIHMVYPRGDDGFFLVDLGIDRSKYYQWNGPAEAWQNRPEEDIVIQAGAGARHMASMAHGAFAYVLGELSGEIFVVERQDNKWVTVQVLSMIPKNDKANAGAAAIRIHPNGKYLYASNRGSNTLAIFKIDPLSKLLSMVGHQPSGGLTPRDFHINPSGNWLIVAHQDSDSLVVFAINPADGTLEEKQWLTVATPVNICWLPEMKSG